MAQTTRYEDGQPVGREDTLFSIREAEIAGIIATILAVEPAKVTREANLVDDLRADSLDVVELVMAIEEHFNITIPDDEAHKVKTVDDAFTVVRSKLNI